MARNRTRFLPVTGPALVVAVLAVAVLVGLVGCGSVSKETKQAGTDAVCAQIDARSADVRSSAQTARLVALVVRDLAPDENIRGIADRVSRNPGEINLRGQLADWVNDTCSR
ncbi:hypothetical protein [Frankia sp. Cas3]|uniref:hypothetical protein n=1 Tax=Frankia sp. Cas3 TaxID=3073926 RepID=UPI002AD33989|nr:hypothetical protein [Frankia sp. Cas3]